MKRILLVLAVLSSLNSCFTQSIRLSKDIKNDSVYLNFINPFYAPIEIKLSALDSTKSFVKLQSYNILQRQDTLKKGLVIPVSKVSDTSLINITNYVSFDAKFGDPNLKINENYDYTLPFQVGKRYKIVQTFGGRFSHNKIHSKYALDIGTQVGDTITAARSGTVFFIKENSKEHCPTRKCVDKANKILVIHDDGTIANYVHLDYNGALVAVGDKVIVGQIIGISGMTGFTTTPHLHFVVHKSGGVAIPIYFKGLKRRKLKKGKYYKRGS